MHFTYLIGWSQLDRWYYGVRTSKGEPDIWKVYFTSSKNVKRIATEHGDPDVIQVRRIHETRDAADAWESKVLKRIRAVRSDRWINKTDNRLRDRNGLKHTEETKLKMRLSHLGMKPMLGKKLSAETKARLSSMRKENPSRGHLGKKHSEESRAKMRHAAQLRK